MNELKEIGGFIELDTYKLPMLHADAIPLNCGRNALAYVIRARKIQKIRVPYFICDSVIQACQREGVAISYYHIDRNLKPAEFSLAEDEWMYLVNYYGQLSNEEIKEYKEKFERVIVDQAQSYFQMPIEKTDTLYSCRKYFGVADGAFLYTDVILNEKILTDESYDRMRFLLGRYERNASEFYEEYKINNHFFNNEPIKQMSKLTNNLLHGIDYDYSCDIRKSNFAYLHCRLGTKNLINIKRTGTFMYPFMVENGPLVRQKLINKKIYIPLLWPSVFELSDMDSVEYKLANNILPLPCDQRYGEKDMETLLKEIARCMRN